MGLLLGSGNTKPQYPYDQWYGVQGDFNSQDYKLKRVGNLDLHRTLPIQAKLKRFVENPDGSVKYYLNQNDSRKKDSGATAVIDSTDGNVMLEKPEYYFKLEIEGTKWIRAYSEYPLPGFIKMERKTVSPWYATVDITNSVAVSGCWLTWNGDEIARDSDGFVILKANALCISVKLKNLKANHNYVTKYCCKFDVVYIRKVKKSESKSQHLQSSVLVVHGCVYP